MYLSTVLRAGFLGKDLGFVFGGMVIDYIPNSVSKIEDDTIGKRSKAMTDLCDFGIMARVSSRLLLLSVRYKIASISSCSFRGTKNQLNFPEHELEVEEANN